MPSKSQVSRLLMSEAALAGFRLSFALSDLFRSSPSARYSLAVAGTPSRAEDSELGDDDAEYEGSKDEELKDIRHWAVARNKDYWVPLRSLQA